MKFVDSMGMIAYVGSVCALRGETRVRIRDAVSD